RAGGGRGARDGLARQPLLVRAGAARVQRHALRRPRHVDDRVQRRAAQHRHPPREGRAALVEHRVNADRDARRSETALGDLADRGVDEGVLRQPCLPKVTPPGWEPYAPTSWSGCPSPGFSSSVQLAPRDTPASNAKAAGLWSPILQEIVLSIVRACAVPASARAASAMLSRRMVRC